ncbi:MAG TPA: hypothetical protein VFS25_18200 [Chitinophaga sp.]|uniref:tetratricopeptide repeat protein n=1 Tax=Chitinophaga sp. TaxID=1869181 RepID=UPI002DBBD278|nr:hypothetical protein [Chitinophaga sp.]HEU4554786.1 hypothetical protein [Chitinophaga sp.]
MRYIFLYLVSTLLLCACGRRQTGCLFDMGSAQHAAAQGYTRVTPFMRYSAAAGYGWLHAPAGAFDTVNHKLYNPAFQSGVWAKDSMVYQVNLPNGDYFMTASLGCKDSVDLAMTLAVDHTSLPDTIRTPFYRLPYRTLRRKITVHGGKVIVSITGQGTPVGLYALEFHPYTRSRDIDTATPLEEDTAAVKSWLQQAMRQLEKDSGNIALRNQIGMVRKYLLACYYFDGGGWSWAVKQTGLSLIYRMYAAADLLEQVIADPGDPLYDRACYLLARTYYWLDQEDDNAWQQAMARQLFEQLQHKYPGNSLLKMYLGQQVADTCTFAAAPPNAPLWAVYQREVLGRLLKVVHWWVTVKQAPDGELGGKYGDDVEMLRWWLPVVLGADDSLARVGYTRLANGVWNSGQLERGFSKRIDDVEHAAELFRDTHPGMFLLQYGNPEYVERCLTSMQNFRDVWTGITTLGHRHFRSYYLSATAVSAYRPYNVDVAMNARALLPGLWAAWYSRNPELLHLLGEWGQAWIADANRAANGKPAGVLPSAVAFDGDSIGGHAAHWYDPQLTYTYYNWDHLGHVNELQYLLTGMYALTQNPLYLQTVNFNASLMQQPLQQQAAAVPGSLAWVQQQLRSGGSDHASGVNPMGKLFAMAKQLSNSSRYDALVEKYGQAYNRYTLSHDNRILEQGLQQMLNGLRYNFPLLTSEVKFTDRVYIPGNSLLAGMYMGHFGAGYEYPSLLASWKNTGREVAVLVRGGNHHALQATLYNFGQQRNVQMRAWQLEPGIYQVSTGLNKQDDDSIHTVLTTDTITVTERVKDIVLTLPARQTVLIAVKQLRAYHSIPQQLPDVALTAKDIAIQAGEKADSYVVRVSLHNIGNTAAKNVNVYLNVQLQNGGVLKDSITAPLLEAPNDLQPRIKKVVIPVKFPAGRHFVKVSAACRQQEITQLNNTTGIYFQAGNNTKE